MSNEKTSKHISRIAAVQIMYQKSITNADIASVYDNFTQFYMKDCDEYKNIDKKFFKKLINHFSKNINLEEIVSNNLSVGKTMYNISIINKSILKTAITEMIFEKTDIPVIINEYVEITKLFSDTSSVKFINAILDKISKTVERKCLINA